MNEKLTILDNLVTSMKYVLIGMRFLHINYEIPENKVLLLFVKSKYWTKCTWLLRNGRKKFSTLISISTIFQHFCQMLCQPSKVCGPTKGFEKG